MEHNTMESVLTRWAYFKYID